MKLYEELSDTREYRLSGGEKIRLRFRHDEFETMIATENISDDPEVYKRCAAVPSAGDREGKDLLSEKAAKTAGFIRETDEEIRELLRKRAEYVSSYVAFDRALRILETADEISEIPCYDWREAADEDHEGREVKVAHLEKQNKVYHAEIVSWHEPMGEQFRLSYRITPASCLLSDGYKIDHKTKIPDWKSKAEALLLVGDLKAELDRKFFPEENPEIPARFRQRLSVNGNPIPCYRYSNE